MAKPTVPGSPTPGMSDADWLKLRTQGRYLPGPWDAVTVVCMDCGSLVHTAFKARHDLVHDDTKKPDA